MPTSAVTSPVALVDFAGDTGVVSLLLWFRDALEHEMCENPADRLESTLFGCMPKQAESFPTSTRCSFLSETYVLGYGLKRSAVLFMPQTRGNFVYVSVRGVVTSKESSLLT